MIKAEDIKIGLKFIRPQYKAKNIETITDILKTYNVAGELVKTRYVATHEVLGQEVKDEMVIVSIQRANLVN